MSKITVVKSNSAPPALGHYSQAIIHNNLIYVSGQLPIDVNSPEQIIKGPAAQTLQTLNNIQAILKEAGSDKSKVLKVDIFMTQLTDWPIINETYATFFGSHKPARVAVPVSELPKGVLIEISAMAALN